MVAAWGDFMTVFIIAASLLKAAGMMTVNAANSIGHGIFSAEEH